MSTNMKVMIMGLFILTAVFKIKAAENPNTRLQCWHCGSDTIGAEDFCGTEFKEDNIPVEILKKHKLSAVRSCNSTIKSEHERAVCRKTIEEINGQTVTKRFCYYTNKSDTLNHCMDDPTAKNVRRIFCEDCLTDQCNGGGMIGGNYVTSILSGAIVLMALFMVDNINV